jgi:ComF family protein
MRHSADSSRITGRVALDESESAPATRWQRLGAIARGVERWLLPGECLLCRGAVPLGDDDALVCGVCRSRWRSVPEPVCPRCGEPLDLEQPCRLCAGWPHGLVRVRSAVQLEGGARDVVHRLKYEGWWRVVEPMALRMKSLEPLTGGVSLIPIPLARKRERLRGYNQSERLATALGTLLSLPVRTDLLRRSRETATQTALTPDERRANVSGAFAADNALGVRAVLVDDVFTTGATLLSAAQALCERGAERVEAVTFGRAADCSL